MITFLSLLFTVSAFAYPSPELVKLVQDSLHPGITFTEDPGPVHFCEPIHVDILGKDPINSSPRHVKAAVYVPQDRTSSRAATVLVVPPLGGENPIDRAYAKRFCSYGVRAAILESWELGGFLDRDLGTYDRAALRALAAAEHLLEYLHPTGSVGILGTSLGAIQASFILGYDSRISTGVLIVGGENLPEIISKSDEPSVVRLRQQQMDAGRFRSPGDFESALQSAIHFEPSTFEDFSGAKNVAFYVGTRDTTVPTKNQYDLVRAFHGSNVTLIEANHFSTVLRTFMEHGAAVVNFFLESF